MTFHLPEANVGLFEEVERRFRLLLSKNIVTGISETQFDMWLSNLLRDGLPSEMALTHASHV